MQIGKMSTSHPSHTGQLLISAGMINYRQLEDALPMAKRLRMPIGRVLLMAGHVNERNLESALMAQQMIRNAKMNLESAVGMLSEASRTCQHLEVVLATHGWKANSPTLVSELGEMLVSATLLSRNELTMAIKELEQNGGSLSRYVIDNKLVRAYDLMNALRALTAFKQEKVPQDIAVNALRTAVAGSTTFDQAMRRINALEHEQDQPKACFRFGELLSVAGLISDIDLIDALEISLTNDAMIGEVLLESGLIDTDFLRCILDVQLLLDQQSISQVQARELMLSVHEGKGDLTQCIAEFEQYCNAVLDLMIAAELITPADVKFAAENSQGQLLDIPELLYESGYIDKTTLDIARRCQRMVNDGFVPSKQAQAVLAAYRQPEGTPPNMEITQVNEPV